MFIWKQPVILSSKIHSVLFRFCFIRVTIFQLSCRRLFYRIEKKERMVGMERRRKWVLCCSSTWHYLLCGRRLPGTLIEDRRKRPMFVFLRGSPLCVAEKARSAEETAGRQAGRQGDGRECRGWLTSKHTDREADRLTDTPDNQSSCGLISARSGTVGEDGQLILCAIHTVTNHKNSRVERNVLAAFSYHLQTNQRRVSAHNKAIFSTTPSDSPANDAVWISTVWAPESRQSLIHLDTQYPAILFSLKNSFLQHTNRTQNITKY